MSYSYLLNIFNELFEDDGLAVVGKGLGVNNLFTKLLLYYSDQSRIERRLVFCLNCSNEDVESIKAACYFYSINEHELPQVDSLAVIWDIEAIHGLQKRYMGSSGDIWVLAVTTL